MVKMIDTIKIEVNPIPNAPALQISGITAGEESQATVVMFVKNFGTSVVVCSKYKQTDTNT